MGKAITFGVFALATAALAACGSAGDVTSPMTPQAPRLAMGAVTSNDKDVPWAYELPGNPCTNTGGVISLTGTAHYTSSATNTANTYRTINTMTASFTGSSVSGVLYQGTGQSTDITVPSTDVMTMQTQTFNVKGPTAAESFVLRQSSKVTFSSTGEMLVNIESNSASCK